MQETFNQSTLSRRSAVRMVTTSMAVAATTTTSLTATTRVFAQDTTPEVSPVATPQAETTSPTLTNIAFTDPEFDGQTMRLLDTIPYRGADIGEVFITARRIPEGDEETWYREWWALGERTERYANEALAAGNPSSARDAFLRACSYFRTASVFLFKPPMQDGLVESFARQRNAFVQAMALFDVPGEAIEIPYDDTTLPGYLLLPDGAGPFPLLIITGGYDGTCEESYLSGGAAAVERGYACIVFDGPGQGRVLTEQHLFFRPDWENVVTPVVDWAVTRPEIDPTRIALMGRSWGGYLAPRAATGEHRLAAVIADAAQYNPGGRAVAFFPEDLQPLLASGKDDAKLEAWLEDAMEKSPQVAFSMNRGMLTHGFPTPLAYLKAYGPYTIEGLADRISCPTLICEGEADTRGGNAKPLYDAIVAPKEYILFGNDDGAGLHDEAGAASLFALRVWNWLNAALDL